MQNVSSARLQVSTLKLYESSVKIATEVHVHVLFNHTRVKDLPMRCRKIRLLSRCVHDNCRS